MMWRATRWLSVATLVFCLPVVSAQTGRPAGQIELPDAGDLDLSFLGEIDADQLRTACRELQRQLQGEYVLDLAPLHSTADALLPWLDQHAETQPYAAWLRARLDYFTAVDELRLSVPAPATAPQWKPVAPINPDPELERRIWVRILTRMTPLPGTETLASKLKPVFAAEGVPPALVWLAEVESRFDPQARSPVGAAGLFQLMPGTAEWLGLKLQPQDQRLDPARSAQAAAKYLKYLHGKFHDWELAVAAYNAGEGIVRRLLAKYDGHDFDDIAVHLPAETQLYVPKVEATITRREGVTLATLSNPRPVE